MIASDEFWTIARNSSSLSRSCRSTSSFSSTMLAQAARWSRSSESLMRRELVLRLAPLGDVAGVDDDAVDTVGRRCRFVAIISSHRYSPSPRRMRTSKGVELAPRPAARSGPKIRDHARRRRGARCPDDEARADVEAGEALGRRALVPDVAVLAVDEHEVGRVLGQRAEPLLAGRAPPARPGPGPASRCSASPTTAERLQRLAGRPAAPWPPLERDRARSTSCGAVWGAVRRRGPCHSGRVPGVPVGRAAGPRAPGREQRRVGADELGEAVEHRHDALVDVVGRRGGERPGRLGDERLRRHAGLERLLGPLTVDRLVGDVLERADVAR